MPQMAFPALETPRHFLGCLFLQLLDVLPEGPVAVEDDAQKPERVRPRGGRHPFSNPSQLTPKTVWVLTHSQATLLP